MTDEATEILNLFFSTERTKVLRGRVRVDDPDLIFTPHLSRARIDKRWFGFLDEYLETYNIAVDGKLPFAKAGEFELYEHRNGLTLYLHPESSWMTSASIEVVDFSKTKPKELEEALAAMKRVDPRIWGELIKRKDYLVHAILMRYSKPRD